MKDKTDYQTFKKEQEIKDVTVFFKDVYTEELEESIDNSSDGMLYEEIRINNFTSCQKLQCNNKYLTGEKDIENCCPDGWSLYSTGNNRDNFICYKNGFGSGDYNNDIHRCYLKYGSSMRETIHLSDCNFHREYENYKKCVTITNDILIETTNNIVDNYDNNNGTNTFTFGVDDDFYIPYNDLYALSLETEPAIDMNDLIVHTNETLIDQKTFIFSLPTDSTNDISNLFTNKTTVSIKYNTNDAPWIMDDLIPQYYEYCCPEGWMLTDNVRYTWAPGRIAFEGEPLCYKKDTLDNAEANNKNPLYRCILGPESEKKYQVSSDEITLYNCNGFINNANNKNCKNLDYSSYSESEKTNYCCPDGWTIFSNNFCSKDGFADSEFNNSTYRCYLKGSTTSNGGIQYSDCDDYRNLVQENITTTCNDDIEEINNTIDVVDLNYKDSCQACLTNYYLYDEYRDVKYCCPKGWGIRENSWCTKDNFGSGTYNTNLSQYRCHLSGIDRIEYRNLTQYYSCEHFRDQLPEEDECLLFPFNTKTTLFVDSSYYLVKNDNYKNNKREILTDLIDLPINKQIGHRRLTVVIYGYYIAVENSDFYVDIFKI